MNKDWHMQLSERVALMYVLSRFQPDISIEIGTFLGGSLRPISAASRQVYSFDIDDRSFPGLPNVEFVTGNSSVTLLPVIDRINASDREINFILIDGDHSEDGVKADIATCLRYIPKTRPTIILLHDSCNPDVRKGIIDAPWSDSPYLHELDLDFVPGVLFDRPDLKGQIWGGFAAALMTPERRTGNVSLQAPFEPSRLAMLEKSIYI
ncbi:class I SAM-dependent methyltransferase [Mesorhizobium sp. AR07]|uniref:class I SAM-dependent methyltransferase n=1 Tax=Mesorhizobium sp. AR07 TaxID=2865838 RepID=UPI00215F1D22|nr:class I SAM-dependent methyltransferase [Mesorhizobium sp. AR07]UVK44422.1 class I SAM-dependent methyltransferase [Mesorhizobium sp. AR07]